MLRISLCSVSGVPCFQTNDCASVGMLFALCCQVFEILFRDPEVGIFDLSNTTNVICAVIHSRVSKVERKTHITLFAVDCPLQQWRITLGLCCSKYSGLLLAKWNWLCLPHSCSATAALLLFLLPWERYFIQLYNKHSLRKREENWIPMRKDGMLASQGGKATNKACSTWNQSTVI